MKTHSSALTPPPPRSIRALVLDFDGTILDTETLEYDVWQAIYARYNQEIPLGPWIDSIGRGPDQEKFSPRLDLQERTGLTFDRNEIHAWRDEGFAEGLAVLPARPGIVAYLDEARLLGFRIGLASSSDRAWVAGHLLRLGLMDLFEAIVTSDNVTHTKPHPELYETVCKVLGVGPRETIAIEDSPVGTQAALSAGVFTVTVPNTITRHLTFPTPDLLLDSLDALPLRDLVQIAEGKAAPPSVAV